MLIDMIVRWNRRRLELRHRRKRERQRLNDAKRINIQEAICIARQNRETFHAFKGRLQSKTDVVLMASGATLNSYVPIEGAVHIGVNSVAASKRYGDLLDCLFIQDAGVKTYYEDILNLSRREKKYLLVGR